MSENMTAPAPLITSDAKLVAAALACGGDLIGAEPNGHLLEFRVGGLPAGWFKSYLTHQLRVDPSEMNAWHEQLQSAIRTMLPREATRPG
jgi:hypothetical protein